MTPSTVSVPITPALAVGGVPVELVPAEVVPAEVGLTDEVLIARGTALSEVQTREQRIKERSVEELIALDKYLRGRAATTAPGANGNAWGAIGVARAVPPDASGTN